MLRKFYAREGGIYGIPYDHQSCLTTVDTVIRRGICIVGPSSCAGALIAPFPFNAQAKVAQVVFWYFSRPREMDIIKVLIGAALGVGATHINLASLYPRNVVGRLYQRMGITPTEIQYLGALK